MNPHLSISRHFRLQASVVHAVLVIALLHHADPAVGDSSAFQLADAGEVGQLLIERPGIETLTPQVQFQRAGRILTFDFQLVDAQGRRHPPGERRGLPPTFTVYKDGEPIGTGSFEYG
jgi:hypothetical protein